MSLPTFSTTDPPLTREESINQIVSSIAMEEVALSHIINAEGEKLQYILGTLTGAAGQQPTIEEVLKVNESVKSLLQVASETQSLLRAKLQTALSSAVLTGPTGATGPTGPTGPATIDVDTEVIKLEPDENPYVIKDGTPEHLEIQFAIPRGATGDTGPIGPTGFAATISAEMAQRVPFDDNPTVVNVGTEYDAKFVFGIPDGMPGATGATGATAAVLLSHKMGFNIAI